MPEQYEQIFDYLYRPPVQVVDPLGPLDLPAEDEDWPSPSHTQDIVKLWRRMSPENMRIAAITALEMALPEWTHLTEDAPELWPDAPIQWTAILPLSIQIAWRETTTEEIIPLEAAAFRAHNWFRKAGESIEMGALNQGYTRYSDVYIPQLVELFARYDLRQIYRLASLCHACSQFLLGLMDLQGDEWNLSTAKTHMALGVDFALRPKTNDTIQWWQMVRRRLAMRDV